MPTLDFDWNLRRIMADHGMFQTTELQPLLKQHGVTLSREQVFRLVTQKPQRLSMDVLMALCAALSCHPGDLIQTRPAETIVPKKAVGVEPTRASIGDLRPHPARIRRPGSGTPGTGR
jgi:DNA-binding Xre family transcriptional regulator